MKKIVEYKSQEQYKQEKFNNASLEADKANEDLESAILQAETKINNGASLKESDVDKILKSMISLSESQAKMDDIVGVEPTGFKFI